MTKQNQLFEAIGCIDDEIAENAIKSVQLCKRKKPLTLIAIAAAAAVLSMLVGFSGRNNDFKLIFHGNNISQRGFTAALTDQQFTIPEEFETLRCGYGIRGFLEMPPSEVYEKLGLTMLTGESFTETKDVKMRRRMDGGEYHTWEPRLICDELCMEIEYCLYDTNIGANVWFKGTYISDNERYILQGSSFGLADENADIVKLKDGSLAMVSDSTAAFCLDGAYYELDFDDYKNESIANIDNMKQVLADLMIMDN